MLWYLYILIITCGVFIGFIRWRHLRTPIKIILLLVSIALIVELLKTKLTGTQEYFLEHIYMRVELVSWVIYYYLILAKNKRIWLLLFAALFVGVMYTFKLILKIDSWGVNYYDYVLLSVCVTIWTGIFFGELAFKPMTYSIKNEGNFWINCGNVLFYPGLVFAFGFTSYFIKGSPLFVKWIGVINHTLNLVLYILYGIAFLFEKRPANSKQ